MPKIIRAFAIFFDFLLLVIVSALFYLLLPVKTERIISVPQGSLPKIITHLNQHNSNLNLNKLDSNFIRFLGLPQSGYIDMKGEILPRGAYFKALVSSKAATKDITLIPGETMYFFIRIIARELNLDEENLTSSYENLFPYEDGVIFPDTYSLPIGADEAEIMQILYDKSIQNHQKFATQLLGKYDEKEWFKIIAIASVVQKEAANNDEMPLVAGVVFNRLEKNMPLQMDGSLNYGKYSHSKVTPERIRNDDSPYNTYRNKGVPPIPSGSVSLEAIKAVINPAKHEYLYFVRDRATGLHKFSKTYKEHINNF